MKEISSFRVRPFLVNSHQRPWLRPRIIGNRAALEQIHDVGSAIHNGIMMEWQCLSPEAANQIFHTNDGTPFSWLRFWDWFSRFFGLEWTPPLADDDPNAVYKSYNTSSETPPVGYGKPGQCRFSFTLAEWSTVGPVLIVQN